MLLANDNMLPALLGSRSVKTMTTMLHLVDNDHIIRDAATPFRTSMPCDNCSMPIIDDAMPMLTDYYYVPFNYVTRKDDATVGNDAMLVDYRIWFVVREDPRCPSSNQPWYIPVGFG